MKRSLLISAFEPFDDEPVNPSALAVERLPESIDGVKIEKIILPTAFGESLTRLLEAVERFRPEAVLCVGQAGGRAEITPERVAINLIDARIADNQGNQPIDEAIEPAGESAYFSTLPVKAMVAALKEKDIPASLSNTAGTFVCNYIMYGLLHHLQSLEGVRGGFVHVPFIPEQLERHPNAPSLALETITLALEICLRTIVHQRVDTKQSEGAES
ncbi:MAG TPA: pyroglutamyl-peptidase I [Tissierellia bacterium]|jgi:pyroglutamyl-peptidase|nr:pyroglutamyl-peptidase I [Tissierellia bacterium]